MSGRVYIGTSGWSYKAWARRFYPHGVGARRQFAHYAQVFPTVEINATFYRLPTTDAVAAWASQAPTGFIYAVKGSRTVTHYRKLLPGALSFDLLLERVRALDGHLGPLLWQLPPRFPRNVERLRAFLRSLPRGLRHAIEFRDESWLCPEVHDVLRCHRAAVVQLSAGWFPHDPTVTADFTYVRFHGLVGGTAHDYTEAELRPWARQLRTLARQGLDAYVYFNNDVNTRAPGNALALMELVGSAAVRVGQPPAAPPRRRTAHRAPA